MLPPRPQITTKLPKVNGQHLHVIVTRRLLSPTSSTLAAVSLSLLVPATPHPVLLPFPSPVQLEAGRLYALSPKQVLQTCAFSALPGGSQWPLPYLSLREHLRPPQPDPSRPADLTDTDSEVIGHTRHAGWLFPACPRGPRTMDLPQPSSPPLSPRSHPGLNPLHVLVRRSIDAPPPPLPRRLLGSGGIHLTVSGKRQRTRSALFATVIY